MSSSESTEERIQDQISKAFENPFSYYRNCESFLHGKGIFVNVFKKATREQVEKNPTFQNYIKNEGVKEYEVTEDNDLGWTDLKLIFG